MKKRLIQLFYILFSVCFTVVCANVIFKNEYYKTGWLILVALIAGVVLVALYKLFGKYNKILEAKYNKILLIFSIAMLCVEIILGLIMRYNPAWDVGAVQKGAIEWAQTGTFASYYDYYSKFTNNLGAMTFLFVFLKAASLFGITDGYAVFVVITSIMITASMALVSLVCKRLGEAKHGIFALLLFAVSPQFWFMGGAVYTDALSMMFPILIFWLYLVSKEKRGRDKLIIYLLMGAAAAVGSLNKITVIIMAIAVIIDMCFSEKPKEIAKAAVCFAGIMAIAFGSLNLCIYGNHLNKDIVRRESRPYVHWIMMGLRGDGRYNGVDYEFTDSFSDPEEKRAEIKKEIGRRIQERGISGMYELACRKSAIDFGDGTYGIADFLGISPYHSTKLHDLVLYEGKNHSIYAHYVTGVHIFIMLLMLLAAWSFVFENEDKKRQMFPMYLGIFGVFMFLLMWETHRRYFSNFAPIIFVCAVLGIDEIIKLKGKIKQKIKKIQKN